ncbi:hypothetical protein [Streptomyces lavendofoliae]|uniref:Uncharacterized protein n=1 Tax=Streptomyces lavendofoliae TaxID=67314 RepID=A0A918M7K6_9ACTN|nr:hypothetical protein [Streptomyces lavendofoliae]GGU67031.1 hypothetical protein GCM10010274_64420 [Streptomyces lavendofoliae]
MTSNEPQTAPVDTGEGIQQIPAVIPAREIPGATDARDALLRAIGQEAQHVADKFPGQSSKALEELARAYALVTHGVTVGDAAQTPQARVSSFADWVQSS